MRWSRPLRSRTRCRPGASCCRWSCNAARACDVPAQPRCDSRCGSAAGRSRSRRRRSRLLAARRAGCWWCWDVPAPASPGSPSGRPARTPRRCSAATSTDLAPDAAAVLDDRSAIFPLDSLSRLRPGTYAVQALLHTNLDLNLPNAPGDLYSPVKTVRLDPAAGGSVALELSQTVPEETLPADTELVKHIKIRSRAR